MFIVGIGSVSAESIDEIGISSSDDVTDDIVAVSDDVSVDDVVAEIDSVDDLNENYHIGPAYFLKLKELSFDQLWTDCLQPLLQEYVQGMYGENLIMKKFEQAYGYSDGKEKKSDAGNKD